MSTTTIHAGTAREIARIEEIGRGDATEFCGNWQTEDESGAAFDRIIAAAGIFESIAEVDGYYLAARPNRQPKTARIDRILFPKKPLKDAGWSSPIGIEIKRSGEKLGPALCQAIDYTYAAFEVRSVFIHPAMIFLWPLVMPCRAVQSVMVHNGVGAVHVDDNGELRFESEYTLIGHRPDGPMSPGTYQLRVASHIAGRKVGSR